MALNIERMYQCLRNFDFARLLVEELGWSLPVHRQLVPIDEKHSRLEIARLSGIAVFEVSARDGEIPDAQTRDILYEELIPLFHESLLIFFDKKRTQSFWHWRKHAGNETFKREYVYSREQPEDLFFKKLDSIQSDLLASHKSGYPEKRKGDHLRPVTNAIVEEFDEQRVQFIQQIEGIEKEQDRALYAMILLCRLLFLYFLQRRGFLDRGNTAYLESHLHQEINYYQNFLLPLCDELSAPTFGRRQDNQANLGNVPYLGGSLFSHHRIESSFASIHVPNKAFSRIFDFFSRYDWRIIDIVTENRSDRKSQEPVYPEITPDILGAIFETYFNRQSQSSAYATPHEVTEYFCKQTIQQFILDKLKLNEDRQQREVSLSFQDFLDLLDRLDKNQCSSLLFEILPDLSILDPACGSGTFLIAALDTLLLVYSKLASKVAHLPDPEFHNWLSTFHTHYPDRLYTLKRHIIAQNLFGVDIIDEAIELARLRLYLASISSLDDLKNLEPLPDIDFNLYAGNSLIGFLHWDDVEIAPPGLVTIDGKKIALERNELLASYRETLQYKDDSQAFKARLTRQQTEAAAYLNQILLEQFQRLQRKYGRRIERRSGTQPGEEVTLKDVERLRPFHWCYVFDQIINRRGGFDIIMTSPPWEIPKGGKSSADYYTNLFYKFASQYTYQGPPRPVTIYKLFLEQCYNLLGTNGYCGIMVPCGICVDDGARMLRQLLFTQTRVTGVFCFENRKALFPGVDPRFEFTLLSFTKGQLTTAFPAAFSRQAIEDLEHFPSSNALSLSLDFVRRFSPDLLTLGKFRDQKDVSISEKIMAFPSLHEEVRDSWNLTLSTGIFFHSQRQILLPEPKDGAFPVYEGKMIDQFACTSVLPRFWIDRKVLAQKEQEQFSSVISTLKRWRQVQEHGYRLVFRSTTSSTNSRTMLATILPPDTFINNTLNFVSSPLEAGELLFLTALLNSFIVDFIVRLRVATHLSLWAVFHLPIPRFTWRDTYFRQIATRAARLICVSEDFKALWESVMQEPWKLETATTNLVERRRLRAELDGLIACIYALTEEELVSILSAFPFVSAPIKVAARNAYQDAKRGILP